MKPIARSALVAALELKMEAWLWPEETYYLPENGS
jgi:hypothetical protein